jgi:hypothetical protein
VDLITVVALPDSKQEFSSRKNMRFCSVCTPRYSDNITIFPTPRICIVKLFRLFLCHFFSRAFCLFCFIYHGYYCFKFKLTGLLHVSHKNVNSIFLLVLFLNTFHFRYFRLFVLNEVYFMADKNDYARPLISLNNNR